MPPTQPTATPKSRMPARLPLTAGLFRFSVAQFLVALILLLMSYPVLDRFKHGDVVVSVLMSLVLISAVMAVSGRRAVLALAILMVLPAFIGQWINQYWPGSVQRWTIRSAELVFVAFVLVELLRFILQAPRVNSEVLCAGVATYLLLGLLWTNAYLLVFWWEPGSFSVTHGPGLKPGLGQFDALYLSFVSLTGLGSNDINPVSQPARMLVMVESTTGVLYLAVLIARLVALYSRDAAGPSGSGGTLASAESLEPRPP